MNRNAGLVRVYYEHYRRDKIGRLNCATRIFTEESPASKLSHSLFIVCYVLSAPRFTADSTGADQYLISRYYFSCYFSSPNNFPTIDSNIESCFCYLF